MNFGPDPILRPDAAARPLHVQDAAATLLPIQVTAAVVQAGLALDLAPGLGRRQPEAAQRPHCYDTGESDFMDFMRDTHHVLQKNHRPLSVENVDKMRNVWEGG